MNDVAPIPNPQSLTPDPILGRVLANYPGDRFRLLLPPALLALVVGGVVSLTIAGVEGWGPPLTVLIIGGVGMALGWYVLHHWNREIILYERGFSYREGGAFVYFTYDEVRGVRARVEQLTSFGGRVRRTRHHYLVTTFSGDQFTITNFYRRAGELGARLTEAVEKAREAAIPAQLAEGKRIPFGERLLLHQNGIILPANTVTGDLERALSWEEYGGYHAADRRLYIMTKSGEAWAALPLAEIENIGLLVRLLRRAGAA